MVNWILEEQATEWDAYKEEFIVDTEHKADWAIRTIQQYRQEAKEKLQAYDSEQQVYMDYYQKLFNQKREKAKQKLENQTNRLIAKLEHYFNKCEKNEQKTQSTLELPSGKLIRKSKVPTYHRDDKTLLEWVKVSAPEFIKQKTVESTLWEELKKQTVIQDDCVIFTPTGEIIEGVEAIHYPSTFEIESRGKINANIKRSNQGDVIIGESKEEHEQSS